MAEWSHLPNAAHISRVLVHLAQNPEAWGAARGAAWDAAWNAAWSAARGAAWGAARDAAWNAAWSAARGAAWGAARDAAWNAAWSAARGAAWGAAWGAARGAIAALIAYDDCAHLLDQTPDFVRGHFKLTNEPAAILLLPAVIAMQGESYGISL